MEKQKLLQELNHLCKEHLSNQISMEHIRLFVESEKQYRISTLKENFNCDVIDFNELEAFIAQKLQKNSLTDPRFQLIVHTKKHYSTIDILNSAKGNKAFLIDAARDLRALKISLKLKQSSAFSKIFIAKRNEDLNPPHCNLQCDNESCSIFALDHAIQVSKIDIYPQLEHLESKWTSNLPDPIYRSVFWEQLPMQLVWNAQSLCFLNFYKDQLIAQEKEDFSRYLSQGLGHNSQGKEMNDSIYRIFELKKEKTLQFVEQLEDHQLNRMIASSIGCIEKLQAKRPRSPENCNRYLVPDQNMILSIQSVEDNKPRSHHSRLFDAHNQVRPIDRITEKNHSSAQSTQCCAIV